jgi:hypothetical protein
MTYDRPPPPARKSLIANDLRRWHDSFLQVVCQIIKIKKIKK